MKTNHANVSAQLNRLPGILKRYKSLDQTLEDQDPREGFVQVGNDHFAWFEDEESDDAHARFSLFKVDPDSKLLASSLDGNLAGNVRYLQSTSIESGHPVTESVFEINGNLMETVSDQKTSQDTWFIAQSQMSQNFPEASQSALGGFDGVINRAEVSRRLGEVAADTPSEKEWKPGEDPTATAFHREDPNGRRYVKYETSPEGTLIGYEYGNINDKSVLLVRGRETADGWRSRKDHLMVRGGGNTTIHVEFRSHDPKAREKAMRTHQNLVGAESKL